MPSIAQTKEEKEDSVIFDEGNQIEWKIVDQ
jgi:hypothetical protein